jgi:negative regulator of sigma E activity
MGRMFGRDVYNTFLDRGPTYTNVNVTEKRAPTDESVALLKEMEEAARKKITESTTVSNTEFTCKLHKYHDPVNCADNYAVIYTLNGQQRRVDINVEIYKMLSPEQTASLIRDEVAFDIANKMLHTAFMDQKNWSFFKAKSSTE